MGFFRLFLALSVLLGHTQGHGFFGLSFVFPEIAVQSFFMISGFYMALVLNEKYNQPGQYGIFIRQRFLRLYPTYIILVALIVMVDAVVWSITGQAWGSLKIWHDYYHLMSPTSVALLVWENLVVLGQDVVMILRMDPTSGAFHLFWHNPGVKPVEAPFFMIIGPSWSLSVEFCFYMLAPFLVRRKVRSQLAILLACFTVRALTFLVVPYNPYQWIYSLFPPNLFFFVAGSLSYVLYRNHAERLRRIALSKPWLFAIFGLIALDYCRFPYSRQLYLIWVPLVFVMVPLLFVLTSRNNVDRIVGELSFPCYLLHSQVLMVTQPLCMGHGLTWLIGPLSIAMTLVFSAIFYGLIEIRTERYRAGLYSRSRHGAVENARTSLEVAPPASLPTAR